MSSHRGAQTEVQNTWVHCVFSAVPCAQLQEAQGKSPLGSAVMLGPEKLHSPGETNIFLLAPAESRC